VDREAFLDRIAQRLGRPRQRQGPAREPVRPPATRASDLPPSSTELRARFVAEFERVGGRVRVVDCLPEVSAALEAELAALHASRVVSWALREFRSWGVDALWQEHRIVAADDQAAGTEAEFRSALLEADVGITTATHAVAATGSLVVTASPSRPRGVSLLPTTHVALVRSKQIVPTLDSALSAPASRTRPRLPSALHVITGPSRTSDIENDLTIGVHGPASVVVILLRESE
jgi:L-lactate dehydrogenase complex protein LldG